MLNATTRNGVAAEAAKALEESGARLAGTGNFADDTVRTSRVYAQRIADGTAVARRLGLPPVVQPLEGERMIEVQAPGAGVVVVLGRDFTRAPAIAPTTTVPLPQQQITLKPPSGKALGFALIAEGGLAFQAEGLPPSETYSLYLYNSRTDVLPLGFAGYDESTKRLAGAMTTLPPTASRFAQVVVTQDAGRSRRDGPGRIVLRGRIRR